MKNVTLGLLFIVLASLLLSGCVTMRRGERMEKDIIDLRVQLDTLSQSVATQYKETQAVLTELQTQLKSLQHVNQLNTANDHVELERLKEEQRRLTGLMENQGYTMEQSQQKLKEDLGALTLRAAVLEAKAGVTPPEAQKAAAQAAKGEDSAAKGADPGSAKETYKKAKALLGKGGDAAEARRLFGLILQKSPKDPLASKAQYGIGESYYKEKKYAQAIRELQKVEEKGKDPDTAADAIFLIAESFKALGMPKDAKPFYEECVARYPKAPAAQRAQNALKKL